MTRNELIRMVERLEREGGFARALGHACLLADQDNLNRLVQAFPELLGDLRERVRLIQSRCEGQAYLFYANPSFHVVKVFPFCIRYPIRFTDLFGSLNSYWIIIRNHNAV